MRNPTLQKSRLQTPRFCKLDFLCKGLILQEFYPRLQGCRGIPTAGGLDLRFGWLWDKRHFLCVLDKRKNTHSAQGRTDVLWLLQPEKFMIAYSLLCY